MLYIVLLLAILSLPTFHMIMGRPRFVPDPTGEMDEVRISIIIPARNEEANIASLLDSIFSQGRAPHEVLVVDDGSADRTSEVARMHGARVVQPRVKPADWNGKPWACQQGAELASGEWLLFLDADTRLLPGVMEKFARLTCQEGRVFSICPYHQIKRPYEQLSAFFNVIMLAGINAFGLKFDSAQDAGLFGQVLLISNQHYLEVGGHGKVRGEVLENFQLAQHLKKMGIRCENFMGRGSVEMRMFPGGLGELWSSWKKGFTLGAKGTAPRALLLISLWVTGTMLALVGIVMAATPLASVAYRISALVVYFIFVVLCYRGFRLAGNFSFLNAALFPVSLLFYQALFATALVERKLGIKTQWKGRDVD